MFIVSYLNVAFADKKTCFVSQICGSFFACILQRDEITKENLTTKNYLTFKAI